MSLECHFLSYNTKENNFLNTLGTNRAEGSFLSALAMVERTTGSMYTSVVALCREKLTSYSRYREKALFILLLTDGKTRLYSQRNGRVSKMAV